MKQIFIAAVLLINIQTQASQEPRTVYKQNHYVDTDAIIDVGEHYLVLRRHDNRIEIDSIALSAFKNGDRATLKNGWTVVFTQDENLEYDQPKIQRPSISDVLFNSGAKYKNMSSGTIK